MIEIVRGNHQVQKVGFDRHGEDVIGGRIGRFERNVQVIRYGQLGDNFIAELQAGLRKKGSSLPQKSCNS